MTKFSKGVAWLEPFYKEVEHFLPKRKKIIAVKGYSRREGQNGSLGCALTDSKEREYTITLQAWTIIYSGKRVPYMAYYMLEVFAHEIAHVVHWDHEHKHMELSSKILRKFARKAKRDKLSLEVRRCKALGKVY